MNLHEYQARDILRKHGIPVPVTVERPYSTDRNLFHISYEGGVLEDPWAEPPAKMFQLTNDPEAAPDVPLAIEIGFERGDPVSVDGERLGPVALLTRLNRLGGEHGVGRVDLVENRFVGMKSRGVYETPGGTILHVARRALEFIELAVKESESRLAAQRAEMASVQARVAADNCRHGFAAGNAEELAAAQLAAVDNAQAASGGESAE